MIIIYKTNMGFGSHYLSTCAPRGCWSTQDYNEARSSTPKKSSTPVVEEEWKPVSLKGRFEYEVSNRGNVRRKSGDGFVCIRGDYNEKKEGVCK